MNSMCEFCKFCQGDPGGRDEPETIWCENGMKQFGFSEGCYMYEAYKDEPEDY